MLHIFQIFLAHWQLYFWEWAFSYQIIVPCVLLSDSLEEQPTKFFSAV